MITARDVLPELYAGCDGLVELRALPSLARGFSTIGDTERRLAFAKQHQKQNLYWGVAARKSDENGTEANCQHLAALYADLDFSKTPETEARERLAQTPLSPSLIVNSGGGLRVYWFLREPLDVAARAAAPVAAAACHISPCRSAVRGARACAPRARYEELQVRPAASGYGGVVRARQAIQPW